MSIRAKNGEYIQPQVKIYPLENAIDEVRQNGNNVAKIYMIMTFTKYMSSDISLCYDDWVNEYESAVMGIVSAENPFLRKNT